MSPPTPIAFQSTDRRKVSASSSGERTKSWSGAVMDVQEERRSSSHTARPLVLLRSVALTHHSDTAYTTAGKYDMLNEAS
ncbi:hypothetical protein E2C01_088465 [Portunus trituberculatus]|uniref:Uncharacterized protein n=1 Tax=Portunus trituberculatus TaxID=210409 RepID=A0A5B7J691_PORTR|nr:hypothetical protein [Portunus trituberculatus]